MTIDGLFKIIGFFGGPVLILGALSSPLNASTAQERRATWFLNQEAGRTGRDLSLKDQQDLLAGCEESLEAYCSDLRKDLGVARPLWIASGEKLKTAVSDEEDEPPVRHKRGKSRLRKEFERKKHLAKVKQKKRRPVAQGEKKRRRSSEGRGNG